MCRRVTCGKCGKPTFAGCGAHVEQVLAGVAPEDRCRCKASAASGAVGGADEGKSKSPWWKF